MLIGGKVSVSGSDCLTKLRRLSVIESGRTPTRDLRGKLQLMHGAVTLDNNYNNKR